MQLSHRQCFRLTASRGRLANDNAGHKGTVHVGFASSASGNLRSGSRTVSRLNSAGISTEISDMMPIEHGTTHSITGECSARPLAESSMKHRHNLPLAERDSAGLVVEPMETGRTFLPKSVATGLNAHPTRNSSQEMAPGSSRVLVNLWWRDRRPQRCRQHSLRLNRECFDHRRHRRSQCLPARNDEHDRTIDLGSLALTLGRIDSHDPFRR